MLTFMLTIFHVNRSVYVIEDIEVASTCCGRTYISKPAGLAGGSSGKRFGDGWLVCSMLLLSVACMVTAGADNVSWTDFCFA